VAFEQPGMDDGVYFGIASILRKAYPEAESVFESGCGTGRLVAQLAGPFDRVAACEPDKGAWTEAGRRTDGRPIMVTLFPRKAHEMPVNVAPFDLLVSWGMLEHLFCEEEAAPTLAAFDRIARHWQAHMICLAPPESEERIDPTHTLLRSSAWWWEKFTESGWEADPEHRDAMLRGTNWGDPVTLFVLRRKT